MEEEHKTEVSLTPLVLSPSSVANVPILIPRPRGEIDNAINTVVERIRVLTNGHSERYILPGIVTLLQNKVKMKLVSNDENPVNFEAVSQDISLALKKLTLASERGELNDDYLQLQQGLEHVAELFKIYRGQKQTRMSRGKKLDREDLQCFKGLDLGGVGLEKDYLDVNVNDSPNDSNYLVIGDAMNLESQFEYNCVDNVIAKLLPLVVMERENTKSARAMVIKKVLAGVNHLTGNNGTASIQFNGNSGEATLDKEELLAIGAFYGFAVHDDTTVASHYGVQTGGSGTFRKVRFTRHQ